MLLFLPRTLNVNKVGLKEGNKRHTAKNNCELNLAKENTELFTFRPGARYQYNFKTYPANCALCLRLVLGCSLSHPKQLLQVVFESILPEKKKKKKGKTQTEKVTV